MPKNSKRNARTVNLADFWDPERASQSATPQQQLRQQQRMYRPAPHRPLADPQALKRAYMLQHFQFILRADLLSLKNSGGGGTLPQGQRRLLECLRSADSLVPWTAVHSVVMRTTLTEFECPICLDTPTAPRITECGHVFCMACILQYMSRRKKSDEPRTCPVCHSLIGVFMLRPVVLRLITPIKVSAGSADGGEVVRFDLFRKEKNSCILYRYDDPRMTSQGRASEFTKGQQHQQQQHHDPQGGHHHHHGSSIEQEVCLPSYDEPCAVQSRYVMSTPEFEANQRYLDAANISERLHDVELLERPLSQYDAAEEQFLLEALNEVTKEPEALAPSLLKNSPPLAPRPHEGAAGRDTPKDSGAASGTTPHRYSGGPSSTLGRLDGNTSADRGSNTVYELYAEGNGQPYYLHMVSVKMLKHDAKLRNAPLPDTVSGRVLDMVSFTQDEESRRIYKVFAHVPLHGSIQLCLLDLSATVLPETMAAFKHTLDEMERRRLEQRRADAMSDNGTDASWQAYLERYAAHRFDSPAILPSDVSLETADDSAPFLQLPSTGSGWEDHGLPPNTLDTRQRATKRQECGPDSLVSQPTGAALATLSSLTSQQPVDSPARDAQQHPRQGLTTSSSANSCWGGGSAARLFKGSGGGGSTSSSSMVVPTWGGHDFTPSRANHHNQHHDDRGSKGNSVGGSPALGAATTPKLQSANHNTSAQKQHKPPHGRK